MDQTKKPSKNAVLNIPRGLHARFKSWCNKRKLRIGEQAQKAIREMMKNG